MQLYLHFEFVAAGSYNSYGVCMSSSCPVHVHFLHLATSSSKYTQ